MAFSNSSGTIAITGTETIATLFADTVNAPSGNSGTYLDRLTQSGGNTTNDWVAYLGKTPLRLAVNSGTFTITGHVAINTAHNGSVAVIAVNGGTLNIGAGFTNPTSGATVNRDFKTSLTFTGATQQNAGATNLASINVTGSGTINIVGTRLYLSNYFFCAAGSTINLQNSEFLIDAAPQADSSYYALFSFRTANLTISNCRFVGRQGVSEFTLRRTITISDIVCESLGVGLSSLLDGSNTNQTITVLRANFISCGADVAPYGQGTNGGHVVQLRNCLKIASTITTIASDTPSEDMGTLLVQGSLDRTVVDSSGTGIASVVVWAKDTNNGNRNNNTAAGDTLGRAYGADQAITLTANGSGQITQTWINCRIWHKHTTAVSAASIVPDDRGPFTIRYRHFSYLFDEEVISSDVLALGSSTRPRLFTDSNVSGSKATAAALTGIALTHNTRALAITGAITLQNIYNRYKSELVDTPATDVFVAYAAATNALSLSAGSLSIAAATNITAGTINLASVNLTLGASGDYSGLKFQTTGTVTITVQSGATSLVGSTFSGTTINVSSGSATVTVSSLTGLTAGSNVTLQTPQVSIAAPNFANGTRVQIAHRQTFTIASTAINTTTDVLTLGNDSNGDAANFRTTAPNTLIRFALASGATIPASTPQVIDGGLYYWKSGGQLSIVEGGTTINFTSQGSGNFVLTAETEISNTAVSGGSGLSVAFTRSANAAIRVKAAHWSESAGTAKSSKFFDQIFAWSATSGITIPDTVNNTVAASQDSIHEQIVALSEILLGGSIQTASGTFINSISPANSGQSVSGLSLALEGVGHIQMNANDADGILAWQDLYLWGCYVRATAAGIRLASANTFIASDIFNFVFENLEFDNTASVPLAIVGGVGRSADGTSVIAAGSGSIALNALSQGTGAVSSSGGGSLTQQQVRDAMTYAAIRTPDPGSVDQKLNTAAKNAIVTR